MPAVVVREVQRRRVVGRARDAASSEEHEPPRIVGPQLAEVDLQAEELPRIEAVGAPRAFPTVNGPRTGVDDELLPVVAVDPDVPPPRGLHLRVG